MFLKTYAMESTIFFWNEGTVSGVLYKNNFVSDLLGSQYLLEILQSSLTVKNNENGEKSESIFRKTLAMESAKLSCVKILIFC